MTADTKVSKLCYLIMLGHLWADCCQGALTAVLPFLVVWRGFSYVDITMLMFACNIASAVIQPLFGWLGDKRPSPWFMALGVSLAGLGIMGVGIFDSFGLIVFASAVTGIGVAMFHPEGGRLANLVAGDEKDKGLSIFAIGGNIGFVVGPAAAAGAIALLGLNGCLLFVAPAAVIATLLLAVNSKFRSYGSTDEKAIAAVGGKDRWGAFSLVMGVTSVNSIVFVALRTFVPMIMISIFMQTEGFGSAVLSIMSVSGVIGTLCAVKASKLLGPQRLLMVSFSILTVLVFVFAFSPNMIVSIIAVCLCAFFSSLFYPSTVAMGQGFIPKHLGMASGLTYGVTISIGGALSPMFGFIGDTAGLQPVIIVAGCFACLGVLLAIALVCMLKKDSTLQQAAGVEASKSK